MPYLSKVTLNPLRTGAQSLLRSPQRMHAAVLGGIPPAAGHLRSLWRAERAEHHVRLLVLTQSRPSWAHLIEQAGWPESDEGVAQVFDYETALALVAKGREFGFRVKLNPKSSTRAPQKPTASQAKALETGRSVRVADRTVTHQMDWLLRRAAGDADTWGFTVGDLTDPTVALTARERLAFARRRGEPKVTLDTATFEGTLRVTDAERFRLSLLSGIGGAKAYGCGLITIAPRA